MEAGPGGFRSRVPAPGKPKKEIQKKSTHKDMMKPALQVFPFVHFSLFDRAEIGREQK